MTFLNPTAFWGLLLGVPIVAAYLLKTRIRQVPVSTLIFWQQAFEELPPRSIGGRLRHVGSLICQLALLGIVVFALADPVATSELSTSRDRILVIDNSSSMQTTSGDGDRFAEARERAESIIRNLRPRERVTIVQTTPTVQVVKAATDHKRSLAQALATIQPAAGAGSLVDAISLADRLLLETSGGSITVLTDGEPASAETENRVEVVAVGGSAQNVGITDLQVRRTLTDATGYELLLEVGNFGSDSVEVTIDLTLNDQLIDVKSLQLKSGQIHREIQAGTSETGGILKAELTTSRSSDNRLPVDDVAYCVLQDVPRLNVHLVTKGNLFLQTALSANSAVELTTTASLPTDRDEIDLLVLHQQVPTRLPDGNVVVIQPQQDSDLWTIEGQLDDPFAEVVAPNSDLLRHVNLTNVVMPSAVKLTPATSVQNLIDAETGDPLYFRISRPAGDVFVLTVDLDQSDLPLRTSFPILFSNLVNHVAGNPSNLQEAVPAGKPATLTAVDPVKTAVTEADDTPAAQSGLSDASAPLQLVAPSGTSHPVTMQNDSVVTPPLNEIGVWRLIRNRQEADSLLLQQIACNLNNAAESDVRRSTNSKSEAQKQSPGGMASRPAWTSLLVLASILVCVEWGLYHRRRIA